ncbi:MAG: GNAT family N-acetyltransferase [Pirellulales bacterium]|nr:GNAT family N-acetyltransferase [Pirellulales bacterium]
MSSVIEVNQLHRLNSYRDAWNARLAETPGATFFHSLSWLETYWRHFGENQTLRVLVIRDANEVQGFVPLVVRSDRKCIVGRCRKLTYPLADWGSFYGPIGANPSRLLDIALSHIADSRKDWDLLDLGWASPAEQDAVETRRRLMANSMPAECQTQDETAVIDLDGTWDDYLTSRTSKWRNNFRRWQRRLAEHGPLRHIRYRPAGVSRDDGDPRWDLYTTCEKIAAESWQGSSTDGTTLSHESVKPFLRDLHAVAASQGAVDLNLLYVGDTPIAFEYGYHYRGSVFGMRVGAAGPLAKLGAGNLLYAKIIEDNFARGDRLFDLGPGSLDIKRHLLTRVMPICRYTHYRPSAISAHLVRAKRRADDLRRSWSMAGKRSLANR